MTGAPDVKATALLQPSAVALEPWWSTFCGHTEGVWCGKYCAFHIPSAELEPLTLDAERKKHLELFTHVTEEVRPRLRIRVALSIDCVLCSPIYMLLSACCRPIHMLISLLLSLSLLPTYCSILQCSTQEVSVQRRSNTDGTDGVVNLYGLLQLDG